MTPTGCPIHIMSDPIQFKPISKGLGFHPFSEGLPYEKKEKASVAPVKVNPPVNRSLDPTPATPQKKIPSRPQMGTGAESAGRPSFVQPSPIIQEPVQEKADSASTEAPSSFYLFNRLFASLVDYGVNLAVIFGAVNLVLLQFNVHPKQLLSTELLPISLTFFILFAWSLIAAQEVAFGTSVGKRIFGLRIEGTPGKILYRSLLFIPSLALGGIGVLMSLFRRDRKCLHDYSTNCQPIEFSHL